MPKKSRSSKTGKFVTSSYAKKHKATTQMETIKRKVITKVIMRRLVDELSILVDKL